jgi:hypothetical protein
LVSSSVRTDDHIIDVLSPLSLSSQFRGADDSISPTAEDMATFCEIVKVAEEQKWCIFCNEPVTRGNTPKLDVKALRLFVDETREEGDPRRGALPLTSEERDVLLLLQQYLAPVVADAATSGGGGEPMQVTSADLPAATLSTASTTYHIHKLICCFKGHKLTSDLRNHSEPCRLSVAFMKFFKGPYQIHLKSAQKGRATVRKDTYIRATEPTTIPQPIQDHRSRFEKFQAFGGRCSNPFCGHEFTEEDKQKVSLCTIILTESKAVEYETVIERVMPKWRENKKSIQAPYSIP